MTTDTQSAFKNITVIGVGLIGGSLALAVKQRYPEVSITGVDKPKVLKRALERHAIDIAEKSVQRAVRSADLIIISTPVPSISRFLPVIADNISPNALVTDTGSVKQEIVRNAHRLFPHGNFIGGHPMTGSEFTGIDAAHPLLFQNAIYILTPTNKTRKKSVQVLANFFDSLDTRVLIIDAVSHDSIVAAVSHLPQLAAVALMNTVGKYHAKASAHLALAAGGFRDMTRIASSPFSIWEGILSANKKETGKTLRLFIKQLKKIVAFVDSNPSRLSGEFKVSQKLRSRIPRSMKGFLSPLVELSVFVEDKPGELARLTSALGKGNVNIKDLELLKVREGRGGTFRLSFENHTVASEAVRLLQQEGFDVG
jgi:prephenate dehydrogenase